MPSKEHPQGKPLDELLSYRITECEGDIREFKRESRERGERQDKSLEALARDHQTTVRRVDGVVLKVSIWAAICGAVGSGVLQLILLKIVGK